MYFKIPNVNSGRESYLQEVKVNSPDYKGHMTEEEAKEDFMKRIENYRLQVSKQFFREIFWEYFIIFGFPI